jgi:hypothetical protein
MRFDPPVKSATSLAPERLLPRRTRAAWERGIVQFACDEINGLFDKTWLARCIGDPCPAEVPGRIQSIVRGLSWWADAALPQLWRVIDAGFDRPEDAFAPVAILLALVPDDPKARAWITAQPVEVTRLVLALQALRG